MQPLIEKNHPFTFVLSEDEFGASRDNIVVASGAGVLEPGAVLGKVTASGKFKEYAPGAADGSQYAAGILGYRVDATSEDVEAVAIVRLAQVKLDCLVWGSDVTTQGHKDTGIAALKELPGPIVVR